MGSYYGERHRVEADRARQDERARRERIEASAVRDRLEKRSGRGLPRASLGLALSQIRASDATASGDVSGVLDGLRKAAQVAGRSDHPANSTMASPSFATGSRSRFDHERGGEFAPELRASRVPDAGGAFHGGASTEDGSNSGSDHWQGQGVHNIEPEWLTPKELATIAAAHRKARLFG